MRAWALGFVLTTAIPCFGGEWTKLPSLPDAEGFAGSYAGVSGGALVVAGGANFPDKKPWDGGKKVWTDRVFVLEKPGGKWVAAGTLPRPLGYGVSVSHGDAVVCVGGSDAGRHYADVFRLEWTAGKWKTVPLPSLPKPMANGCGALVGDVLYVAGGLSQPESNATLKSVYRLDLLARNGLWEELPSLPGGGRMLSVAAGFDGAFFVSGGVDFVLGPDGKPERQYLRDAYRYDPRTGWKRLADLPSPIAAAPSPAPTDATGFHVLGGDDGTQVGATPERHRGFSRKSLHYNVRKDEWEPAAELTAPRVTTPCVRWHEAWVVPTGEIRPGVRSPEVWQFLPK